MYLLLDTTRASRVPTQKPPRQLPRQPADKPAESSAALDPRLLELPPPDLEQRRRAPLAGVRLPRVHEESAGAGGVPQLAVDGPEELVHVEGVAGMPQRL